MTGQPKFTYFVVFVELTSRCGRQPPNTELLSVSPQKCGRHKHGNLFVFVARQSLLGLL